MPRTRRFHGLSPSQAGGALLLVVVLIGVVLILAAAAAPFVMKEVDLGRRRATQQRLEEAFHGVFPGNRKARASLHGDFGFSPVNPGVPPLHHDLRALVDRARVGDADPSHATVPQFNGSNAPAWNGPYWQGSVDGLGRPVDGWGRPLQLRFISTTTPPGWQVFSPGGNGSDETGNAGQPSGDDLAYPVPPYQVPITGPSVCPAPGIVFQAADVKGSEWVSFTLELPSGEQTIMARFHKHWPEGRDWTPADHFTNVPPGTWTIRYWSKHGTSGNLTVTIHPDCSVQPAVLAF